MNVMFILEVTAPAIHAVLKLILMSLKLIKDKVGGLHKTGPVKEHHKGNILPHHNVFKPGAHPS
jgi:hypothetical protein